MCVCCGENLSNEEIENIPKNSLTQRWNRDEWRNKNCFHVVCATLSFVNRKFHDWRIHEKPNDTSTREHAAHAASHSITLNKFWCACHTHDMCRHVCLCSCIDHVCANGAFGKFIFQIHHVSRPKIVKTSKKSIESFECVWEKGSGTYRSC